MHTVVDDRLVSEVRRYKLRFSCEHCAHWDGSRDVCAHGYPTAEHRVAYRDENGSPVFCKEWELGD